ncbi:MAG: type IV pilus modification protein PilV [Methylobacter sp.]|nr:MAG: type IV pilus modification protein PilV [Methylobacter sp.]
MNTINLILLAREKKLESARAYLGLAFKDFAYPVYLFGSYATGQFHGYSDVDILIISPDILSAKVYRVVCDKMTELCMSYDILISPSLNRLDSSIVSSLQTISATVPFQQHQTSASPSRYEIGFTLIEVLVSMVILAIGLLGLASLQGISLKNSQDAYLYSQANALAYEMSDRIKANKRGWNPSGTIVNIPIASCAAGCNTVAAPCTTAQMAAYDYCYWQQKAITTLSAGATAVVSTSPKAGSTTCVGAVPSLCLTMTWSRINQDLSKQSGSTALQNSTYELEVTP